MRVGHSNTENKITLMVRDSSRTNVKIFKNFKKLVPMRKKIKIDIGSALLAVMFFITPLLANANFLRASAENLTHTPPFATYTAPANVGLTNTGQNTSANYTTRYVLVRNSTQVIAYTSTTPNFSNVPVGDYSAYAVNYNSTLTPPNLSVGVNFSSIGGDCVNQSSPFPVSVISGSVACLPATAGVGTISAVATGNNTSAGFNTTYVLTNSSNVIINSSNSGSFSTPATVGEYRIYAINYSTSGAAPVIANGTNINAIGGDCAVASNVPKCFTVTAGNVTCTNVSGGAQISATASGHNTSAGFTTRYALTNASGTIQSVNSTGTFTAPNVAGEVRIYAVNYSTSGAQPTLTAGTNINAIGGDCAAISGLPRCFNVTPTNVTCVNAVGGSTISASATGNNTAAGFTTQYVLTNASGVIRSSNSSGSFTAPNETGEFRIYAVNYSTSGAQPSLTAGTNIAAIGGACVDVSDIPKCFNITPAVVNCTTVNAGSTIAATTTGNNTSAGFTTVYVLTNASGAIQSSNATGSFIAPITAGEYRIYAVNYLTSGVAPTLTNGTNIAAIGGECVDISDNYKCFTVRPCPTQNCLTATVTRIR
jgi:hypothetical protein